MLTGGAVRDSQTYHSCNFLALDGQDRRVDTALDVEPVAGKGKRKMPWRVKTELAVCKQS